MLRGVRTWTTIAAFFYFFLNFFIFVFFSFFIAFLFFLLVPPQYNLNLIRTQMIKASGYISLFTESFNVSFSVSSFDFFFFFKLLTVWLSFWHGASRRLMWMVLLFLFSLSFFLFFFSFIYYSHTHLQNPKNFWKNQFGEDEYLPDFFSFSVFLDELSFSLNNSSLCFISFLAVLTHFFFKFS